MSERVNNPDRPGDPDAMTPVNIPPEEAQGPEQPPAEGVTMAPTPPSERDDRPDVEPRQTEGDEPSPP